jgi:hypothetical protein
MDGKPVGVLFPGVSEEDRKAGHLLPVPGGHVYGVDQILDSLLFILKEKAHLILDRVGINDQGIGDY